MLLSTLILTSCATKSTSGISLLPPGKPDAVKDGFCSWAEPIYPSRLDTEETRRQIMKKHNIPYETKCTTPDTPK